MIATADGETPVEKLTAGDKIRTRDGRLTPVKWVGTQAINVRLTHPAKVNPVCITAGALGGGVPERDLYLSADLAIEIGGTLYNAGALGNGATIYQLRQMPREGFTYYHVETEAHELLLAKGVPAESCIDYASRDSFDNAPEGEGRVIPEMSLPRVSTARLVPADGQGRLRQRPGLHRRNSNKYPGCRGDPSPASGAFYFPHRNITSNESNAAGLTPSSTTDPPVQPSRISDPALVTVRSP